MYGFYEDKDKILWFRQGEEVFIVGTPGYPWLGAAVTWTWDQARAKWGPMTLLREVAPTSFTVEA